MKVLVTGATGFLGRALARRLIARGDEVTAAGRSAPGLASLESEGMKALSLNLEDTDAVRAACEGQEVVFHCAARSSAWGPAQAFYQSNVQGTRSVVNGCLDAGVHRLVHVSTPSIYFRFESRLEVDEDAPLPEKPANEYARTKLMAEAEVDRAFRLGLPVITIRPRAIFGEGDNAILPRLISRLQSGRLRVIGDGQNITDLTYVENVVDALLLCEQAQAAFLGKKYNITNGEPLLLWGLIGQVCTALRFTYPQKHLPYSTAMGLAATLEAIYRLLPGQPEPLLTRYMVGVLAKSTTLNIAAARRDLGYVPRVSVKEGFDRYVRWWKKEQG